jgi:hypothetical protein
MILFFPNPKGLPLEEIAAIFGDVDEVAVYQRDLVFDENQHVLVDHGHNDKVIKLGGAESIEDVVVDTDKRV